MKGFVLLAMIFCHIVADFTLQGILGDLKQKRWWKEHHPADLYKHDWIVSLVIHSISWTFATMFPIAWWMGFECDAGFFGMFILNVGLHAYIDHLKANELKLNLVQDQLAHLGQILNTWIMLVA